MDWNLMLTTACNLCCPYCFAKETISAARMDACKEMPLENIRTLIRLFRAWNISPINILGGEPTLHSRFKDTIGLFQENGFPINVYTNGIVDRETVDFLAEREGIELRLNHNEPSFYTNLPVDPTPQIRYFFEKCRKNIHLRFAIHGPHFEGRFLIEKIKQYNLKKLIGISFAHPICSLNSPPRNTYLRLEDYRKVAPKLVEFAGACGREGIRLGFSCVVPLCTFSKEEYGELFYSGMMLPIATCIPVIDIGPDLSVWRCFPLSGLYNDRKITEFRSRQDVYDYFNKKFGKFQTIGGMDQCFKCQYMKQSRCQGGCIAHVINKFRRTN